MTSTKKTVPTFKITAEHLDMLNKSGERHKYDYGHAVVVSGPPSQGGAARLAARCALRIGAGLVSVLASHTAQAENAAQLNAIMLKSYVDKRDFAERLTALDSTAICIGPNLGICDESRAKLADALSREIPLCIDADAITLIAQDRDQMKPASNSQVIMTPHEGELRRLIPDAFATTSCRVTLAQIAAKSMNCIILFKGLDTVIARPDGAYTVVSSKPFRSAAWLATAGTGDALSGIITGLLARGFSVFDAAAVGANVHLHCADIIGPGLIADDIPEAIPDVLKRCLNVQTAST
jgi:hydroxyethylthiazole kinase-like uncharacterized protein yjeF